MSFKVGDVLLKDYGGDLMSLFQVVREDFIVYLGDNVSVPGAEHGVNIALFGSTLQLAFEDASPSPLCTCNIVSLMQQGCSCGAIKRNGEGL